MVFAAGPSTRQSISLGTSGRIPRKSRINAKYARRCTQDSTLQPCSLARARPDAMVPFELA